jgi:hypothetical protein
MRSWVPSTFIALTIVLYGLSGAQAQKPSAPAILSPCPFTPAEIGSVLGISVEDGQAADMSWPGGRDVGCLYAVKDSNTVVSVRQTWDLANTGSSQASAQHVDSDFQAVTGDPDGAKWKAGTGHEASVELIYSRGKVKTKVLIHGDTFRESDLQPKMLKLRRVP